MFNSACITFGWIYVLSFFQTTRAQVSPKLAMVAKERELRRGQRFQSVCSALEGDIPLNFHWVKNGQPLIETSDVSVRRLDDFSATLIISAVREDHAGNYTCVASNMAGSDSYTTRLKILVPPTWLRQPYDISVLSGGRVTLNCETTGTPKPTVQWKRSKGFSVQKMEPLSDTHWRASEGGSLTTTSVRKEDEGFYSCEVTNGVGEGLRKTVRVEVQVPPVVSIPETLTTVKKGEKAQFRCNVTGDTPLTVLWKKGNFDLNTLTDDKANVKETRLAGIATSILTVRKTASDDSGLYSCTSKNAFGESHATVRLSVVESPGRPRDFSVQETWSRSVRLAWNQPYNGNSPLKHYIIKHSKKMEGMVSDVDQSSSEMKVGSSQNSAVVNNLKPNILYTFQLIAENEVGVGEPSLPVVALTCEEEPEASPTDVRVEEKTPSSIRLSWNVPSKEKWNGDLKGFYIGHKKTSHVSKQIYTYHLANVDLKRDKQQYILRGLQESTSYTVVVKSFNSAGIGPPSERVLVKTSYGESPVTPSVNIEAFSPVSVKLKIQSEAKRRTPPNEYILHLRQRSNQWNELPLPLSSTHVYSIGGLVPGSQYQIYVTARNKFGDSGPTEVLDFRTEASRDANSVFHFSEEGVPFYQKLSFIIPVAVSLTVIIVVPLAACCCLQKLTTLPPLDTEGVEARGFTYTPAPSIQHEPINPAQARSLPQVPPPTQSTYSTLQNYGSVMEDEDPRYDSVVEEMKTFISHNALAVSKKTQE